MLWTAMGGQGSKQSAVLACRLAKEPGPLTEHGAPLHPTVFPSPEPYRAPPLSVSHDLTLKHSLPRT